MKNLFDTNRNRTGTLFTDKKALKMSSSIEGPILNLFSTASSKNQHLKCFQQFVSSLLLEGKCLLFWISYQHITSHKRACTGNCANSIDSTPAHGIYVLPANRCGQVSQSHGRGMTELHISFVLISLTIAIKIFKIASSTAPTSQETQEPGCTS